MSHEPRGRALSTARPAAHGQRHRRRVIVCNRACIQPRRPAFHPFPVLATVHFIFAPGEFVIRSGVSSFVVSSFVIALRH